MLFVDELEQDRCTVTEPSLGLAVDLEWDPVAFPTLWIWMKIRGTLDPPFLGETVALAIEPQSSDVPSLAAALEAGKAPSLAPGASTTASLRLSLRTDPAADAGFR